MAKLQFPWELLKAECLRLVCTQLAQASEEGGSYQGAYRKDDMIGFLRDIEEQGLELAVKNVEQTQTPRKTASTQAQTPLKRKSSRLEEGNEEENDGPNYNTRYKGSKRVKLTKEDKEPVSPSKMTTPRKIGRPRKSTQTASEKETLSVRKRGRPRKSTEPTSTSSAIVKRGRGRPRKSGASEKNDGSTSAKKGRGRPKKSATTVHDDDNEEATGDVEEGEQDGQQQKPKRGRGRPKKSAEGAASKAPVSRSREVFDGVVLKSRKALLLQANNATGDADADGEADPSGGVAPGGSGVADGEEEIVVAAAVDLNGFIGGEAASAPDSSNKENDPNDMVFISVNEADIHVDVEADAEGDDDVAP